MTLIAHDHRCVALRSGSTGGHRDETVIMGVGSGLLGLHLDGATGAFVHAQAAALAVVQVDLVRGILSDLDHRVVRADPIAVVTAEAVAARQAPARLEERVVGRQPVLDLLERRRAARETNRCMGGLGSGIAGLAGAGQILTNRETRALLAPGLRDSTRPLAKGPAANRAGEQQIFEVIWHEQRAEHARPVGELPSEAKERELRLCVRYGRSVKLLDKHRQSLHMGRDGDCEIIIRDRRASRQHALIERRGDLFVLKDVSTNGTFVTVHGESELFVLHEEFVLRGSGVISFAASAGTPSADIAEFEHV